MGTMSSRWGSAALNVGIVALGLVLSFLVYGLVTRALDSGELPGPAREAVVQEPTEIIQVEIRNGNGKEGVAKAAARYLRSRGFDVLEMGNHTSFDEAHSLIIDRVNDSTMARQVAEVLGIKAEYVSLDPDPEAYLDVSIILGHDYLSLTPFQEQVESEAMP